MTMSLRYLPTMLLQIPDDRRRTSCEQDDASTSSTMTVERQASTKQEESNTDDNSTKRSVRFCMAKNESYSNNGMCKEDLSELWYDNTEYKHFRNSAMYTAKEIVKVEARNKAPFSYERVMSHAYLACCKATSDEGNVLTEDEFKHLVRWAEVATNRLGLEKWSIRSVGHDRSFRRSLIKDMVYEAQNNYQADNISLDYYISEASANISRPMRLYARTLAEAQAAAAQKQELSQENEMRVDNEQ
jgi:hypothetical protein